VNKIATKEKKVEANERRMDRKIEPTEFELCTIQVDSFHFKINFTFIN
jgi:hypothetical protein